MSRALVLGFMEEMENSQSGRQAAGFCVFRATRDEALATLVLVTLAQPLSLCLAM